MPDHKKRLQLVLLGRPCVGKSTLTIMFIDKKFLENYDPTIERNYSQDIVVNEQSYELNVCDSAGLDEQSQIYTKYLASDGFILVYSITDRQSFDLVKTIYERINDELNGEKKPIILIGNKSDMSEQRRVEFEEGKMLAHSWGASFMETSAKIGNNVDDLFVSLVNEIDTPDEKHSRINQGSQPLVNNNGRPRQNVDAKPAEAASSKQPNQFIRGLFNMFKKK